MASKLRLWILVLAGIPLLCLGVLTGGCQLPWNTWRRAARFPCSGTHLAVITDFPESPPGDRM
jgi:hypothetical protein